MSQVKLGNFLPTGIGSLPHAQSQPACRLVLENFSEVPFWPQLPQRTFLENMYVQFSSGMPALVTNSESESIYFDLSKDWSSELNQLLKAQSKNDLSSLALDKEHATGFFVMLDMLTQDPPSFFKAQVTGPISFGLTVTDHQKKPILYHDVMSEVVSEVLGLKAKWQESYIREKLPSVKTIIFVDEPYLAAFGSSFVSLNREQVLYHLKKIFSYIEGIKGVHCCGNTDWSLLLDAEVDILSFDAYDYFERLSLYPEKLRVFLEKGGYLAWGIVPTATPSPDRIEQETVENLLRKLKGLINQLIKTGLEKELIYKQSLITPNCGTGSLLIPQAEKVFIYTRRLAEALREQL